MSEAWCDEFEHGFGWTEPGFMQRTSHAFAIDGRVFLFDALEAAGVDERIAALGEPVAVIQLLGRHERDCASVAARLGVPHLRMPWAAQPLARYEIVRVVKSRFWNEVAFWSAPDGVLVVADALGTAPYFLARGELLGVHPLLRLTPPRAAFGADRARPRHLLCGHGAGIHGDAAALALEEALTTARSRIPRYLTGLVRGRR